MTKDWFAAPKNESHHEIQQHSEDSLVVIDSSTKDPDSLRIHMGKSFDEFIEIFQVDLPLRLHHLNVLDVERSLIRLPLTVQSIKTLRVNNAWVLINHEPDIETLVVSESKIWIEKTLNSVKRLKLDIEHDCLGILTRFPNLVQLECTVNGAGVVWYHFPMLERLTLTWLDLTDPNFLRFLEQHSKLTKLTVYKFRCRTHRLPLLRKAIFEHPSLRFLGLHDGKTDNSRDRKCVLDLAEEFRICKLSDKQATTKQDHSSKRARIGESPKKA